MTVHPILHGYIHIHATFKLRYDVANIFMQIKACSVFNLHDSTVCILRTFVTRENPNIIQRDTA